MKIFAFLPRELNSSDCNLVAILLSTKLKSKPYSKPCQKAVFLTTIEASFDFAKYKSNLLAGPFGTKFARMISVSFPGLAPFLKSVNSKF